MVKSHDDSPLHSILKAKTEDAHYEVSAQAVYYPNSVRVFIPDTPFKKRYVGFDAPSRAAAANLESLIEKTSNEDNLERSLRRTRKAIKDYVLCNDFELFCTFTFAKDRQNIPHCKSRMSTWLKNQRALYGQLPYLIVPEFHKDGESLHFHALLGNYGGKLVQSFNTNSKPILQNRRPVFELPGYRHGFTNVKKIETDPSSRSKVAFYLQKYVTKDMPVFANKNRYWASHGLRRPIIEDNPSEWYKIANPDWDVVNEHGRIIEFNYGTNPVIDMFIEEHRHDS